MVVSILASQEGRSRGTAYRSGDVGLSEIVAGSARAKQLPRGVHGSHRIQEQVLDHIEDDGIKILKQKEIKTGFGHFDLLDQMCEIIVQKCYKVGLEFLFYF